MTASNRRLRSLTALLLAALFLLTTSVPALAASGEDASGAVPWTEMTYEHFDAAPFKEKMADLSAAAEDGDADKVISLYDELYDEYIRVYTYDCIATVHNSQDVNDDYWADELVYCDTLVTELSDAFCTACHQILDGPCADDFAAHVGENAAQEFRDYEPMTARELELTKRETELTNEYTALMDKQYDTVYTYDGEDWTLDRLDTEDSAALSDDEYYEIAYGIYGVLAQDAAAIYQELVSIRTEQARINDYDDYNHYAYEMIYGRDYTPEQAQDLFDEVKQISQDVYTSDVQYMTDEIAPTYDTQEDMLAALHEYTSRVDPIYDESWRFMTENGLCDIAAGSGRASGAYTIDLPAYDSEFIYSDEVGSYTALSTLFHEFGHFTAGRLVPAENYLTSWSILDLAEIHSTGMELLVLPFYDEIYDEGADIARYGTMYSALTTVTDQALFAEFEARVYADPDSYATAEALNKLYNDVSVEYGYSDVGSDPTWITVPHFFESPDYIVSYVTAALASIQIWAASQEDWQTGVDIYMDIVRQGQYDLNYFDVVEGAGLKSFDTAGVATEVCGRMLDAMAALEAEILGGEDAEQAKDAPEADAETAETEAPAETVAPPETEAPADTVAPPETEAPADTETPADTGDVLDVETHGMADGANDGPEEEDTDVLG